jgi:hypothetical protein
MQTMNEPDKQALLPITTLEFGFHHLDVEVTATVAQAIIAEFDVLASETVRWEMSECDGSPSIKFDLSQSPWLLESDAFRPVIDAMYKECVEMIKSMAKYNSAKTTFRCISVGFDDDPSAVDTLQTIFNIDPS